MKEQLNFFNTIMLDGRELDEATLAAKKQNDRIYLLLKHAARPMTPFELHGYYIKIYTDCPVTSIRRGMTTLTTQGKLEKLEKQKAEQYGKPNHLWQVTKQD